MHAVYNFVSGPLVWVSFILFFGGSIYRIVSMARMAKKTDPVVYHFWSLKYAMRSISHWIIPFASENMRKHPAMTIVTFAFHICLFIAPLFLFAHIIQNYGDCPYPFGRNHVGRDSIHPVKPHAVFSVYKRIYGF